MINRNDLEKEKMKIKKLKYFCVCHIGSKYFNYAIMSYMFWFKTNFVPQKKKGK